MADIIDFVSRAITTIVRMILWGIILYCIGYVVVWIFTLGRYPQHIRSPRETHLISGAGLLFLLVVWLVIAGYNNFIRVV